MSQNGVASVSVRPIEDHAMVGDTRTAALVSSDGEITWMCVPRFDGVPIFGSLLAGPDGGRFVVRPVDVLRTRRRYREGSTILETTWHTPTGRARLTDGMVTDVSAALLPQALLVRGVECLEGEVEVEVLFDPRHDLGERPRRSARRAGALVAEWGSLAVLLRSAPDLELRPGEPQRARVRAGQRLTFALGVADRAPGVLVGADDAWSHLETTDRWWRRWSEGIEFDGPMRDSAVRSLITLRLLTFAPSGAPVAAPTTSLPERIGGDANWDYRFSWPRDACLGAACFLAVGKTEEAETFLRWLDIASRLTRPRVQVLYDLVGKPGVEEHERRDVPGYAGSLPVRIGNAACDQHQLDTYGWICDAVWQLDRAGRRLEAPLWRATRGWADFVCAHWREPDSGIWELREEPRHFVHSKLMGWLALDRAIELADGRRVSGRRLQRWREERAAIAEDVRSRGVDDGRDVYVQRYGSRGLDASLLRLPGIGLEEPRGDRVGATIDAVAAELDAGDGLLFRYSGHPDEGAFLACSFWLVTALCDLGRTEAAAELLESLCARSNDVGLFGEEMDPSTGAHLGNFPQALTHSALAEAAISLARATGAGAGSRA